MSLMRYKRRLARLEQAMGVTPPEVMIVQVVYDDGTQGKSYRYTKLGKYWHSEGEVLDDYHPDKRCSEESKGPATEPE